MDKPDDASTIEQHEAEQYTELLAGDCTRLTSDNSNLPNGRMRCPSSSISLIQRKSNPSVDHLSIVLPVYEPKPDTMFASKVKEERFFIVDSSLPFVKLQESRVRNDPISLQCIRRLPVQTEIGRVGAAAHEQFVLDDKAIHASGAYSQFRILHPSVLVLANEVFGNKDEGKVRTRFLEELGKCEAVVDMVAAGERK